MGLVGIDLCYCIDEIQKNDFISPNMLQGSCGAGLLYAKPGSNPLIISLIHIYIIHIIIYKLYIQIYIIIYNFYYF